MRQAFLLLSLLLLIIQSSFSQVQSEWRGIGRTGVYQETGLLEKWPTEGPELLWHNDSLALGHSSVAIAYETIYVTGRADSTEVLFALEMNGKLKWKTTYGRAWTGGYPNSRSTPTIDDNRIYVSSGLGDIACVNATTGKIEWSAEIGEEHGVKLAGFGYAESLLIKDDMLFVSPIGEQTNMIALNKITGEKIWQSKSLGDSAAYCSPILIKYAGLEMVVNVGSSDIFALNVNDGSVLWSFKYFEVDPPERNWKPTMNSTTPLYSDGHIYVNSGYNHVGVMLKLNADGKGVELLWKDSLIDTHHGGVVKLGDYIFGSNWINNGNGNWCCIDWETGEKNYETKWNNKGSIIANDGLLYCYDEKRGNIAIVKPDPEKFEPISSFKIPYGKGPHWSHPVIKDGILYVRHGKVLMAYNIKADKKS
ncbi:MAG: PQQ-binding-like beta-propeller repeat protein [Bacteroidota bacterium]